MKYKNIFSRALLVFTHRILKIQYGKKHYLRLDIDIDDVNRHLADFNLPVVELTFDDFLRGDTSIFKGKKLELYRTRCSDSTYKAFGIFENGKLVYSTWISLKKLGQSVETRHFDLAPNEGLLEDSYCAPEARGKGYHGLMNYYRIKKIFESGRTRVVVIVLDGNTPAMKVQMKSGFKELGTFYSGYIFGFKFNTLKKYKFDAM
jgi:RimJ/RimL family protein N-acetyltransferase